MYLLQEFEAKIKIMARWGAICSILNIIYWGISVLCLRFKVDSLCITGTWTNCFWFMWQWATVLCEWDTGSGKDLYYFVFILAIYFSWTNLFCFLQHCFVSGSKILKILEKFYEEFTESKLKSFMMNIQFSLEVT